MSSEPYQSPDLVTAYSTSSTSLVVKWSHVPKQDFTGKPIGYNIYYMTEFDDDFQFVSVNYPTNITTLTKLQVDTVYYIIVAGVSSGGVGFGTETSASTGENRLLFLSCLLSKESSIPIYSFTCCVISTSHFHFATQSKLVHVSKESSILFSSFTCWVELHPLDIFIFELKKFYFPGNPCLNSPCLNNGTCQSSGAAVSCNCTAKFDGNFCQNFVSGE